jgi:hypothetical protein
MSGRDQPVRPGWLGETDEKADASPPAAWNVVATTKPGEFNRARALLQRFGPVRGTDYYNLLVLSVPDVRSFLEDYAARFRADPRLGTCVTRIAPAFVAFDFGSAEEFQTKAREAAIAAFAPALLGKSFHVRMHRRGLRQTASSQTEKRLGHDLLQELERRGAPGTVTFEDPDALLDIETVDGRAGMSLWTRDDLERFPFIKVD